MVQSRATRKKPIVLSSDSEEDESHSPPPKRPKRGTLTGISDGARRELKTSRVQTRRVASPKLPASSTEKSPAKQPGKVKAVYKPITSFFKNATRSQSAQPTPSPEKSATPLQEIDDILDSSDDDRPLKPSIALPVRKSTRATATTDPDSIAKGRQRFLPTARGVHSTPPPPSQPSSQPAAPPETIDRRPWTEQYGPVSLDELAVHKRKVTDVQTWLADAFGRKGRKRLLLLKGPAGSGKTTTMALLSKELGIDMHEWKNPINSMSTSDNFASATAQFEDFVGRTGAFGALAFDEPTQARSQALPSTPSSRQKQLVLVEEFPNTFARASSAVHSFRSSVLHYLAANVPSTTALFSTSADPEQPITPIVMIISETLLSTNTAAADSFTAHRLLGPEILTHPGVSVIEFNPIAPTYMTKALDTIVLKEARKSGRKKTVGPQVIQRLAGLGDIRSAVSSLEFLCLRGDDAEGWGAKVNFTKKKGPKDVPITKMEKESLEMVTQRESTLGIFHAVGRVVYNKRLPEDSEMLVPQPPNCFPERRRPKASEVNLDTLIDELGTDTQTFTAALHENYVLSCGGADSEETMDSLEGCVDALSDADLLSPDRFGDFGRRNFQGTSADNLRQDEMCFHTSVRGLLYNLPNPVRRLAPPPGIMGVKAKGQGAAAGAPKGNAFAMYYPSSLRLWRQQEEIGDLLEMWIMRAQRGELFTSTTGAPKLAVATGGVETWRRNPSSNQPSSSTPGAKSSANDEKVPILLGSGGSARSEMLLERLPYLPIILRKSRTPNLSTAATIRDIQKITSFIGNNAFSVNPDDAEDDLEMPDTSEHEQWATDKSTSELSPRKKRVRIASKDDEAESAIAGLAEKGKSLILSDDDIED
ncbi:Rad17-domain-containing protein [Dothidotthia symphoricarpi CBS 119687]|uniref:Rad17-domain-containing protein n=1 Tax=Dothidotthia symphoricarpi CBS 119687 TaxID=1392245 RepID=A0A6A6AM70_9PLEO|nr:Rad17-domain-containing protein [Dothidotthia symphoricarpi CBS 119687]KAF2132890.1 Rad17-domain-containing protein [Dothidotthia symphoricarpi CBS 119687]